MLQIKLMGGVTELIRARDICIARTKESPFCRWSHRFQTKVPSENINLENLEIETAFLVETCGRFPRPGFWGCAGFEQIMVT